MQKVEEQVKNTKRAQLDEANMWNVLQDNWPSLFKGSLSQKEGDCSRIKRLTRDFPGGPVVKNPPSNAGDTSLIPGRGTRIPHATGQLSPHATTRERKPARHN